MKLASNRSYNDKTPGLKLLEGLDDSGFRQWTNSSFVGFNETKRLQFWSLTIRILYPGLRNKDVILRED